MEIIRERNIPLLPTTDSTKREQQMDHASKQQIVSFGLCAVKRFVVFLLTERAGQRHCERQHSKLKSPNWWSHFTPLPPSKAPKTHPNSPQHTPSTCCDPHINNAIDTLLLWEQVPKNFFFGRRLLMKVLDLLVHHLGIFRCVVGALEGSNSVSPLIPLNVQNWQHEAAIWRPTERREKVKASTFLSCIEIVDDRLNPPKSAVFL